MPRTRNGGHVFNRPLATPQTTATALRADGLVTVVAEAAQGFEGSLTLARQLVRAAAAAGADLVKFQLVYADEIVAPSHQHFDLFRELEMPDAEWQRIADEAANEGVGLACDVFGSRSLALACAIGAQAVKIHASDALNHALVADALAAAPHVYLSTGGLLPEEVLALVGRHAASASRMTLLYGFQAEPTPTGDNNLRRLQALCTACPEMGVGFMDHADGASDETTWLALLAVPLGVVLIEKHLTLDRELRLEDYVSAASPADFAVFVRRLRAAEQALGRADLALTSGEAVYRRKALKVVIAGRDLPAGHVLAPGDVRLLRTPLAAECAPIVELERAHGRALRAAMAAGAAVCEGDLR